jgi:hypothetical protein
MDDCFRVNQMTLSEDLVNFPRRSTLEHRAVLSVTQQSGFYTYLFSFP